MRTNTPQWNKRKRYVSARMQRVLELLGTQHSATPFEVPDSLEPPAAGIGHNSNIFAGIEPQAMTDRTYNAASVQFAHLPHVDVDENIGLTLMMGLSNKITFRELLTSAEQLRKGKKLDAVDCSALPRTVTQYLNYMASEGKEYAVIVIRFPNTQYKMQHAGNSFNAVHGEANTGHWLRIPILVKTKPVEIVKTPSSSNEWTAQEMTDEVAQSCGFANARCMQNSRPIGLNNHALQPNGNNRDAEKEPFISELGKLRNALNKLAARKTYVEKALSITPQECEAVRSEVEAAAETLQRAGQHYKTFESTSAEDRPADFEEKREEARLARNKANAEHAKLKRKLETYEYCLSAKDKFTAELTEIVERIDTSTQARTALEAKIEEIGKAPAPQNKRFNSDTNPSLLTFEVKAATRDAFIEQAQKYDRTPASNDRTQDLYLQTYREAENWLETAKRGNGGSNYLSATHKFFEYKAKQAGLSLADWFKSEEFMQAEKRVHDGAKSPEHLAAISKAGGADGSDSLPGFK